MHMNNEGISTSGFAQPLEMLLYAAMVCLLLFLSEHDPDISLKTDYSGTVVDFAASRAEGSMVRKLAYPAMGLMGLTLLFRSGSAVRRPMRTQAMAIALLVVLSVFSVLWGGNAVIVLRRVVVLLCLVMATLGFAARFSLGDLLLGAFCLALAYLGIGIAAEIAHGTFLANAEGYRFAGTLHPNVQAQSCGILVISGLTLLAHSHGGRRICLGFLSATGLAFLFLTQSRTNTAACTLTLAILAFLFAEPRVRFALASGALALSSFVVLLLGERIALLFQSVLLMNRSLDSVGTLTGRVPLWEHCLAYIAQKPFVGHGYNNFWSPEHVEQISNVQGWVVGAAHSTYLELLLDLGLFGLLLYAATVLSAAWRSMRAYLASRNALFMGAFGLLAFSLSVGALETFVIFYPNPNTFFLLCLLLHITLWDHGTLGADDAHHDVLHG